MQLDRTHVVIRRRALSEIGDLSLVMMRRYPSAILIGFFAGAVPWIIANAAVLYWIPILEWQHDLSDEQALAEIWRYLAWMTLLVILETPAAGIATTLFLGQAVFESQPTWASVFAETRRHFWRWFWKLGVVRLAIPTLVFLSFRIGQPAHGFFDIVIPIGILIAMAVFRSNRPFLPEILVLEQCPLRSSSDAVITAGRRSKSLHQPMVSDLGGRFLAIGFMLLWLFLSILYTLVALRGFTTGVWDWDLFFLLFLFPAAIWTIAGVSVIVRLLNYLDTRIRLEGWEVELAIRAETMRQFGEEAGLIKPKKTSVTRQQKKAAATIVSTVLMGIVLSCTSVSAAESSEPLSPASDALGNTSWFDKSTGTIVPVQVETTVDDSANRSSRWLPKPPTPKKQKPAAAAPATTGTGGGGWGGWLGTDLTLGNLFGWLLLVGIIVGAVSLLLYALSKTELDLGSATSKKTTRESDLPDQQTVERMKHLPAELRRSDVNLRSEAERLMTAGQLDQAVILLFAHQLLLLDRAAILRLNRGKTNGRYVRETKSADFELGRILRQTTDAFESSYFGRHSLSVESFAPLWADNAKLEKIVHQRSEVAA
ncbi:hypothetical protein Q31b_36790 [Novipirellula aureliae]|uniref:DUF4129 domain-containing protein n=1 Tax=Novipirellula aureliae TaxID=2527966 RepID=A0A5C6DY62_9BACT|nr:hypothetical protein [Novipirellula aureliae]TWU40331.1 hypothetical protein Q31b_36790 [Novipirellula aureliae]